MILVAQAVDRAGPCILYSLISAHLLPSCGLFSMSTDPADILDDRLECYLETIDDYLNSQEVLAKELKRVSK
jgi:hypothetical protein